MPRSATAFSRMRRNPASRAARIPRSTALDACAARNPAKYRFVETVQAHVQSLQAGLPQSFGLLDKQDAVGRQGDVRDPLDPDQPLHQLGQAGTQQRLAAGQPQLAHAAAGRDADEPFDLVERQDFLRGHELGVVLGHAVDAAQVAAIGHADPQVRVHAAEAVDQSTCHGAGSAGPASG